MGPALAAILENERNIKFSDGEAAFVSNLTFTLVSGMALLRKSSEGRSFPFPVQTYPSRCVRGDSVAQIARDSLRDSKVLVGLHEQAHTSDLSHDELARLQFRPEATRFAADPLPGSTCLHV